MVLILMHNLLDLTGRSVLDRPQGIFKPGARSSPAGASTHQLLSVRQYGEPGGEADVYHGQIKIKVPCNTMTFMTSVPGTQA
jgi:hypothetical protein